MKKEIIISKINQTRPRSYWGKGVKQYALDILNNLDDVKDLPSNSRELETCLLNGASNWGQYSNGAFSLIYSEDIATRLYSPRVVESCRKKNGGFASTYKGMDWLDIQAIALEEAFLLILQSREPLFKLGDEVFCEHDNLEPKRRFKVVGINISDVISYDCVELGGNPKPLIFNEIVLYKA